MPKVQKLKTNRGAFAKKRAKRVRSGDDETKVLNPSQAASSLVELGEFVIPGFVGYGANRLISRVVYTQVAKRKPNLARHAAVGASLASLGATYALLDKVQRLKPYHAAATIGMGIAAAQAIVQTYLPRFGWMVSDYQPITGGVSASAKIAKSAPVFVSSPARIAAPPLDEFGELDSEAMAADVGGSLGTEATPQEEGGSLGPFPDDEDDDANSGGIFQN